MNSKRQVSASMPQEQDDGLERVLAGYRSYLLFERGVSTTMAGCYELRAQRFLGKREEMKGLGLDWLPAAEVSRFLTQQCPANH